MSQALTVPRHAAATKTAAGRAHRFFPFFKQILLLTLLLVAPLFAVQVRGRVVQAESRRPLPDANIQISGTATGTVSNSNGEFKIELPAGKAELVVSYIGYETQRVTVDGDNPPAELRVELMPKPLTSGEVVVTSLRYEQSLKNIAMPISIVGGERIEALSPRDVAEAVRNEPGLSVTRDGVWGSAVTIRGLSRNNIVALIDGNRIDTANDLVAGLSMIDVNDVERIEVIKGAASSLYGSGAVGGVVNVLTRDGWYDSRFYMSGSVAGSYGSMNEAGSGNLRLNLGSRRWYAKLSAQTREAGDARTPIGVLPNSRYSDTALAARFGIQPFENHELKINLQQYRGKDIGIPGGYPLFPDVSRVRYPRENRDLVSVEYRMRNLLPSLPRISLRYFQQNILRDVENIPYITKQMPGTPAKVMNVLSILPRGYHQTDGVQLQSDWLFAGHHVVFGLDAWQKHLDSFRERVARIDVLNAEGAVVKSISQITAERPIPVATYRSTGLFVQDELPTLWKRLTLTVGGRYDLISVENEAAKQPLYVTTDGVRNDAPTGQTSLWTAQKVENRSWSGNVAAVIRLTPEINLTANVARSFRAPYLEERYQYIDLGNLVKVGDPSLKPEKGLFGDVGVRFYGSRASLSMNLFYNRIEDMVVEAPSTYEGRSALKKTNVGTAVLYGAEIRGDVASRGGALRGYASAAYVYGQDRYLDAPLPLIPPFNGTAGLEVKLGGAARAEFVASFFADQERIASWEKRTPGYALYDLYLSSRPIGFAGLKTRLVLGVENLFDRAYRDHLSTNRGSITVQPGRNVIVRLQTDF